MALQASGISVGLPWGEAGNSEVGHITMGAGKIIYQNLPRISLAIQDGSFFENEKFINAYQRVKENGGILHIMGLVSTGVVHASTEHLYALLDMAKQQGIKNLAVHVFSDGRDSDQRSGVEAIKNLQKKLNDIGIGQIASISGRNWAMDRNNNWDRIEKAYKAIAFGEGNQTTDPVHYLEESYKKDVTDEYVEPCVVAKDGKPIATVKDGDAAIFFNFREDRARQMTKAFTVPSFEKFTRPETDIYFVTMVEYEEDLTAQVAFPPEDVKNSLGEVLSKEKKRQLRIAETEKYAHVTYFFNGGIEEPWEGEDHALIPSPSVARFDETPEMSSPKITETVIKKIEEGTYDFILINYANADMVAHTGNEEACKEAARSIDKTMSILIPAVIKAGGCLLVSSDHGNIEVTRDFQTGRINTEHDPNPVPLWFIAPDNHYEKTMEEMIREQNEVRGMLGDIAPTVLDLMGIEKPKEMHGESLLGFLKKH